MSRALSKNAIAALKKGDNSQAFKAISQAVAYPAGPELLDIEVLGSGHPAATGQSVLIDGNAIGIPKLSLVRAFIVARQILQKHLQNCSSTTAEELIAATAVVLLMDGEHITAANLRKKLLLRRIAQSEPVQDALDCEKRFLDSLLTSRLHRQTKSPTLWSHRRWLLEQYGKHGLTHDVVADLQIVMISGERHPRNYYAWCHARLLTCPNQGILGTLEKQHIWDMAQKWCYTHHDDVSGWSFLYHLGSRAFPGWGDALLAVFKETLGFAQTLAWRNESVWWFLRTVGAFLPLSFDDETLFCDVRQTLYDTADETCTSRKTLGDAWQWYNVHRNTAVDNTHG